MESVSSPDQARIHPSKFAHKAQLTSGGASSYLMSGLFQDALTDLTGDSERLPVEEQHGTWLGHKVGDHCFKVLVTYNTHILLHSTASSEIFPPCFLWSPKNSFTK